VLTALLEVSPWGDLEGLSLLSPGVYPESREGSWRGLKKARVQAGFYGQIGSA